MRLLTRLVNLSLRILHQNRDKGDTMTDELDKSGKPKRWAAWVFGLLLVGCSATLPPPTNLAVLIALSSPTPTLISDYEPTGRPQPIIGKVIGVSDGDTITVLDDQKRQHKIRLEGIDAPESKQDYGSRAKQSLSDLVFGKTVTVTSSKRDRYGLVLGKVTLEGKNINLEQINRGMAWFYRYYAKELKPEDATAYDQAEAQARKEKRGLWAAASPKSPWNFRRDRTSKGACFAPPATPTGRIVAQELPLAKLPGLQQGLEAKPRPVQD
jgi:endonuclease YncB( thermonuclease family)